MLVTPGGGYSDRGTARQLLCPEGRCPVPPWVPEHALLRKDGREKPRRDSMPKEVPRGQWAAWAGAAT